MGSVALTDHGGRGAPVVLVHGLMGRGTTWADQLPWLTEAARVYTYDAPWHRGRDVVDDEPISTERFVADLADAIEGIGSPVTLVGHSMGGLHSWCLAAQRPELVTALVVEDMSPDFRGRTTGPWEPWLYALPVEFSSRREIDDAFGDVAGRYFAAAFDRTATGWRLHGQPERWVEIAGEWGRRAYWRQWHGVVAPTLLIEAGNSVTPPGQMRQMHEFGTRSEYVYVPGVGHLVHDEAPTEYRAAVTRFLTTFAKRA
jgi:pimeloyl-ACP methyl ester carboxylesterase